MLLQANLDNFISGDLCNVLHHSGQVVGRHLPPVEETMEVSCRQTDRQTDTERTAVKSGRRERKTSAFPISR